MSLGSEIVVRLRPGSDGDATHIPPPGTYTQVDPPTLYLQKTGQTWMQNRGEARPGLKYILERLPAGYTMWQRSRPGNPKHVDKYVYGHPNQRKFDSPNRFYPHFQYLMDNAGDSLGCPCTVCVGSGGVLPPKRSSSTRSRASSLASSSQAPTPKKKPVPLHLPQTARPPLSALAVPAKGRPKLISAGVDVSRVDEEGTPDVYRNLIDKLKRHNTVDEIIEEPVSPDWRAEQASLPGLLHNLSNNEQWEPRAGDIVLYVRDLPNSVDFVRNEVTGEYLLYDEHSEEFLGPPVWEAGLIGQTSTKMTTIADLTANRESGANVSYSGVRVEPIPNPNHPDKSSSKRHKYVSLRQTRPFVLWQELLHETPKEEWHPTIISALTLTSTLSLMGKYRFRGTWPNASIYCHGFYLGYEMLVIGDTIRLLQNSKSAHASCSDIMVIKSIRLKFSNLHEASNNDYDKGRPYNSEIWIYGTAYTSDPGRSNKQWLSDQNIQPPKAAGDYSSWYPLHPSTKDLAIPFSRVLGRLYERRAMAFFLNSEPDDLLSIDTGREGLMYGRMYGREHDERISQDDNATWYWGDNRADALNLQSINGLDTVKYDNERDMKDWRKKIKLIEGMAAEKEATRAKVAVPSTSGAKGLRSFMAPGTSSQSVHTNKLRASSANSSPSESTSSPRGSPEAGRKRGLVMNLSDDEDEEQFRKLTKVMENVSGNGKKKAKVMVLIDD